MTTKEFSQGIATDYRAIFEAYTSLITDIGGLVILAADSELTAVDSAVLIALAREHAANAQRLIESIVDRISS